jgi:hypothetical protein
MAPPNRLRPVIDALQKEEGVLAAQLNKVRDAIAALGGASREYRRRQTVRKAKTVVRNARKMTAAQKAEVSKRMKTYGAGRRKATN